MQIQQLEKKHKERSQHDAPVFTIFWSENHPNYALLQHQQCLKNDKFFVFFKHCMNVKYSWMVSIRILGTFFHPFSSLCITLSLPTNFFNLPLKNHVMKKLSTDINWIFAGLAFNKALPPCLRWEELVPLRPWLDKKIKQVTTSIADVLSDS